MDKNPAESGVGIRPIPFGGQVLAIIVLALWTAVVLAAFRPSGATRRSASSLA